MSLLVSIVYLHNNAVVGLVGLSVSQSVDWLLCTFMWRLAYKVWLVIGCDGHCCL